MMMKNFYACCREGAFIQSNQLRFKINRPFYSLYQNVTMNRRNFVSFTSSVSCGARSKTPTNPASVTANVRTDRQLLENHDSFHSLTLKVNCATSVPAIDKIVQSSCTKKGSKFTPQELSSESGGLQGKKKLSTYPKQSVLEMMFGQFRDLEGYKFTKPRPPHVPDRNSSHLVVSQHFWLCFYRKTEDPGDLVEAWSKAATSLSKGLEPYADDRKLDVLARLLTENLSKMNIHHIANVVHSLTLLYAHSSTFTELVTSIDQRLCKLIETDLIREEDLDIHMEISCTLLRWSLLVHPYRFKSKLSDMIFIYFRKLLDKLLRQQIDMLNNEQFVFCMFLAGLVREFPGINYEKIRTEGFVIPDGLEAKLIKVLPQIGGVETGLICHGLHLCYFHLTTSNKTLRTLLIRSLLDFPDSQISKNQLLLICTVKFMRKRGTMNKEFVKNFIKKIDPHLYSLNSYSKLRLLQLILSAGTISAENSGFVKKLIASLDDLTLFRLKDLELLMNNFLYLGVDDRKVYTRIQDAVEKCDWSNVRSGRSYVYLISNLAKVGIFDVPGIETIMREVNSCDMSDLSSDNGLGRAIDFLFNINVPALSNKGTDFFVVKFLQRNRFLSRNCIFQVLELDFLCDIYNVALKVKLNPDTRNTIFKIFRQEFESNRFINVEKQRFIPTYQESCLQNILLDLKNILLVPNNVIKGYSLSIEYPLPISTVPQIIFRSETSATRDFKSDNKCSGEKKTEAENVYTKSRQITNKIRDCRLVVFVAKRREVGDDGLLLGRTRIETELLRHLKIPFVIVDAQDYVSKRKEKRNLSFLRALLKSKNIYR